LYLQTLLMTVSPSNGRAWERMSSRRVLAGACDRSLSSDPRRFEEHALTFGGVEARKGDLFDPLAEGRNTNRPDTRRAVGGAGEQAMAVGTELYGYDGAVVADKLGE
jgi:hypothetical protein